MEGLETWVAETSTNTPIATRHIPRTLRSPGEKVVRPSRPHSLDELRQYTFLGPQNIVSTDIVINCQSIFCSQTPHAQRITFARISPSDKKRGKG